ncbi:Lrp/AsnC family transcriptional regulator [Haloglycomyces albus]|uniref:Lrp/AsnC family transcriptional regulator n=1 Tax=Haloglycomyces albus TaxID=526067 RepID=UPI00046CE35F|nr:Lrp/AsnC family transcriptional regulator [Haloglycomyces albus]
MTNAPNLDVLDAKLIALLNTEPRLGVMEYSRRLGVARGTVQARLDKLRDRGVISGFGPEIDPDSLGYTVTAFVTLELRQDDGHHSVSAELARIPYVLEAHTVSGSGDMLCRVVARTNADLQRVIDQVLATPGVQRASTVIALADRIPYRTLPLVAASANPGMKAGTNPPQPR